MPDVPQVFIDLPSRATVASTPRRPAPSRPIPGGERPKLRGRSHLIDHVTRLPSRQHFLEDMETRHTNWQSQSALVLVTIAEAQHFNHILRALGHAFADDLVRAAAARLAEAVPDGSILYHVSMLGFAFLTPLEGEAINPEVPEALVQAFTQPIMCGDVAIATRIAIGVFCPGTTIVSASEALRAALAAAQDSRGTAEGWAYYHRDTDVAHQRAFQLLADLRLAISCPSELSMVYQPRVSFATGRAEGAEALIRWTHPTLGPISPVEFIPLAEATDLMTPLTWRIMDDVLGFMSGWPRSLHHLRMSLNISPSSLHNPGFADHLRASLIRHNVAPHRIELELTEGSLTSSETTVQQQLARIRDMGISVAIDDFGTGYSNFEMLVRVQAQVIKLDQSFIRTIDKGGREAEITRRLIAMGHALGFQMVAEGIETKAIFDLLGEWGCDQAQGYLLSRPLPDDALLDWLSDQTSDRLVA